MYKLYKRLHRIIGETLDVIIAALRIIYFYQQ